MPPWKESTDAMLTIFPDQPAKSAFLAKAWQRKNTDFRLTSITSSQSVSEKSTEFGAANDPGVVHQAVDWAHSLPDTVKHGDRRDVIAEVTVNRREDGVFCLHQRRGLAHRGTADTDDFRHRPLQWPRKCPGQCPYWRPSRAPCCLPG